MTIDAVSRSEIDWHAINWRKVYPTVRRLQARIVKAVQEGKWRKVRSLQRLLTHSFSGKSLHFTLVSHHERVWQSDKRKQSGGR